MHRDYKSLPHEEFGSTAQSFEPATKEFKSVGGFEPVLAESKNEYHSSSGRETSSSADYRAKKIYIEIYDSLKHYIFLYTDILIKL